MGRGGQQERVGAGTVPREGGDVGGSGEDEEIDVEPYIFSMEFRCMSIVEASDSEDEYDGMSALD